MPGPNTPAITLRLLIDLVMDMHDIPLPKRRELCSAIRAFAKVCSLTPEDIIADPGTIRTLAAHAPWLLAGYKKGSWANTVSRLRQALELGGIKVHRQRRNFKLDATWENLFAPLSRRDHDGLHRFAGWCSVNGISPEDVSPAIFQRFYDYLEEQMVQRNPRERAHVARRAWNRAIVANNPPFALIPAPTSIVKRGLRWDDFPQSLQAEVQAYSQRMLEEDLFDDQHRAIKPVTVEGYLTRLRMMLTTLVQNGMSPEGFASLRNIVDPDTVKRAFELRLGGRPLDDRARMDLHGMATAILSVARYLGLEGDQRAKLKGLAKKVRFTARGMCEKNKQRLAPLFHAPVRNKLLSLPLRVAHDLESVQKPSVRQAQRMQMAVVLELLLHIPMRIRNLSELDLATTIIPPIAGSIGGWRISIAANDVKNQWEIEASLGEHLGMMLDRFVNVFRPALMKHPTTALFLSQGGKRKGPSALAKHLAAFVRREIGVTLHAHLMRHLAAHLYLLANPGDYETVRRILGHKSIETTMRFYVGLETEDAFARHDALIEEIREKASGQLAHTSQPDLDQADEVEYL